MNPTAGLYVTISGLVALHSCPYYSLMIHGQRLGSLFASHPQLMACIPGLVLFLFSTPMALRFQSSLLAYISVMGLCQCIGFSVLVYPFCYCIGWRDGDSMVRSASTAALVLTGFVTAKIGGMVPEGGKVFQSPVSVMGSILLFLCLLIMSNLGYRGNWIKNDWGLYLRRNVIFLACATLAISVGNVFVLTGLANTAVTFLVLWVLDKYCEFHFQMGWNIWIWVLLMSAGMYQAALWLHTNPAFVASLFSGFNHDADAEVVPF